MKILLFGKNGQLGWELNRTLEPLGNLHALNSMQLDVGDLKALERVIYDVRPHIIVNASAYTAVDRAEEQPDLALQINGHAPRVMAEVAHAINATLIHFSTDYVFDGAKKSPYNEKDLTNPINVYGQTKLKGEQAINLVGGAYVILRTSWVYSMRGDGFVSKVLSWARRQETLRIVTDQIGSPTSARMLAEIGASMIAHSLPDPLGYFSSRRGIYHLGGSGNVSRFDFARYILALDPRPEEQKVRYLEPVLTVDFPTPARRPLHTSLDCSLFENVFDVQVPNWRQGLRHAMGKETSSD